ncbi:MAG: hypothetical protein KAJ51_04245 [Thermoplasmata archaeon]|nr:hypothetical protein [Thermoplasmata archaeon]
MKEAIILDYNPQEKDKPQYPPKDRGLSIGDKVALVFLVILVIFFSIYVYNFLLPVRIEPPATIENIIAEVHQGDSNMTSGCLFTITKGSGKGVEFEDIEIKVSKKGEVPITLRWRDDGNFSYDLNLCGTDNEIWTAAETMGFDAPPELQAQNIVDGDTIEVSIVKVSTGNIVFQGEFVYHD